MARGIIVRHVFAVVVGHRRRRRCPRRGVARLRDRQHCDPTIGLIALAAFPAMILGGLDSPLGAVIGGFIIGVTQTLTAGLPAALRRIPRQQLLRRSCPTW